MVVGVKTQAEEERERKLRWNSCDRKARYDTHKEATKAAEGWRPNQYVYDCDWCKGFHLTKSRKP